MHTMNFDPGSIEARVDSRDATVLDVFPGFDRADRLGVVVDASVGMLGASLLIHAFGVCYYKVRRDAGRLVAQYPEVYVVHVGGRFGDLRMLDVLPERKEVFVADGAEALAALNHAAVTRVAVPSEAGSREPADERPWTRFHPWEAGPARDRVRSSYLYAAGGQVEGGAISLVGRGRQLFDDVRCIFDIEHTIAEHAHVEEDPEGWTATLLARAPEVRASEAQAARARWAKASEAGELRETYAMLPKATDFLRRL